LKQRFSGRRLCFPAGHPNLVRYSIWTVRLFLKTPPDICLRVNVGALIACENGIYVAEAVRMGCTLCAVRGPGVPHHPSRYVLPLMHGGPLLTPI